MKNSILEKNLHLTFEIGIFFKAFQAFLEIIAGAVLILTSQAAMSSIVSLFTEDLRADNPENVITKYGITLLNNFSPTTQHFVSVYLMIHGSIKLIVVIGLLKKIRWAYPAAGIVFTFFIVYQVQRFFHTHSPLLLFFAALDFLIILLTWHEYSSLKKKRDRDFIG
jgi:uncharacterized membrane protein